MSVVTSVVCRGLFAIATLASTLLSPADGRAEWMVAHGSGSSSINFENSVLNVNQGRFAGAGLAAIPEVGQLDSDSWLVAGFSSGNTRHGQNYASSDFARGLHAGGVTTGGLYGFETSPANRIVGVQATGSDFNPGSIQLSVATSIAEQFWILSFDWWVFNDKPRSSQLEADFSTDGTSFQKISSADLLTPTTADASATWQATTIGPQTLDLGAPSDKLWLRWSASDFAGASSRDEFGIDNIAVQVGEATNASSSPEPSAVVIWLVVVGLALAVGWDRKVSERIGKYRGVMGSEGSDGIGMIGGLWDRKDRTVSE